MFEAIKVAMSSEPGFVAVVITLMISLSSQAPSKLTFFNILRSYGVSMMLIIALVLQTQSKLKEISSTAQMNLKISRLEKIIEDNKLKLNNEKAQEDFDKKMKVVKTLEKIKLL